eukprot:TRINITY_DN6977_c0_g1_i1.p1 TRINITY_DN6977_c0_g1~~TRINITY_DN6977_c0_g1_i1.p1  ORF type:complete len:106 (-),score=7.23 TRINITY_DN6977_c0_g1_i1:486-803(-)
MDAVCRLVDPYPRVTKTTRHITSSRFVGPQNNQEFNFTSGKLSFEIPPFNDTAVSICSDNCFKCPQQNVTTLLPHAKDHIPKSGGISRTQAQCSCDPHCCDPHGD